MHAAELWYGKGFLPAVCRTLLTPLSWLYAAGWEAYLAVYRLGFKKAARPHSPIICVGNLVAGGSGKTPTTINLVQVLSDLGREVAISASGYGSPAAEAAQLAPSGPLDTVAWGDEPALLRQKLPDVPIIVGRRRVLAATICAEQFPARVLVMDDGFQHLPLRKDLTIILDPDRPNVRCLPAGPYREPRRNRRRADLCLPGKFRLERRISQLDQVNGSSAHTPDHAIALCAIAQPDQFAKALAVQGIKVERTIALPDHHPLATGTLGWPSDGDLAVVVTEKDWVKLRERSDLGDRQIWVAIENTTIEPADEFRAWLKAKLDAIEAQRA